MRNAGGLSDIFEPKITFVEIQFVRAEIGGKKQVWKSVVVDVPSRHATAIVEIEIILDVKSGCILNLVHERNAALFRRNFFKAG